MKAIILAAGSGSRLAPLSLTTPKLLIPILNKTILQHHLDAIAGLVDEVIIVIGPDQFGDIIKHYVADHHWPLPIRFAIQTEAKGTAHAYQAASNTINPSERLLCLNGDDLYSAKDLHHLATYDYAVLGQEVADWQKWGILNADAEGKLLRLVEKPDQFMGNLANTGAFILSTEIFDLYEHVKPSSRGEYEFTETVTAFAQLHHVQTVKVEDYWLPIGYPWHILEAHEKLAASQQYQIEGQIEDNVTIKGQLSLGKGSVIKSGSYLEGNVIIGQDCEIGPNAYLRGNTVIGNDTKIGFSVEVNNSTLFGQTKIPHFNFVGHSILGYNARFAAGAVTADRRFDRADILTMVKGQLVSTNRAKFGTVMGDHSYLGCNAVVYPGRKIWPNLNVMPGQVVTNDKVES